ncbi:MAG: DinB family protein [bacterium]|nr:DinB family protein [bacterium]
MNDDRRMLEVAIDRVLTGRDIHVGPVTALEGLDWEVAGRQTAGFPHSILQLVNHMTYWQHWVVKWLDGQEPPIPEHASGGWPGSVSPATEAEWEAAVAGFLRELDALNRRSRGADLLSQLGEKSRLEVLQAIAAHNSYHLGQVVALRQMLGVWPAPSGGLTW